MKILQGAKYLGLGLAMASCTYSPSDHDVMSEASVRFEIDPSYADNNVSSAVQSISESQTYVFTHMSEDKLEKLEDSINIKNYLLVDKDHAWKDEVCKLKVASAIDSMKNLAKSNKTTVLSHEEIQKAAKKAALQHSIDSLKRVLKALK